MDIQRWRDNPLVRRALADLADYRPVLETAIAGIPELVRPGDSGWLVPAGSVAELADAMEDALDAEPDRLRRMGAAGAALVADRHDVRREAARLASLFPLGGAGSARSEPSPVPAGVIPE